MKPALEGSCVKVFIQFHAFFQQYAKENATPMQIVLQIIQQFLYKQCLFLNFRHFLSVYTYNLHGCMWMKPMCLFFILSGCVSGVGEVNSRTVGVVLRSCKSQCEFHLVLQRAEDHLKRSLRIDGVTHMHSRDQTRDRGIRDVCSSETVSKHTTKEREGHTNRTNHRDAMRCKSLV